jgi:hypothetical protein
MKNNNFSIFVVVLVALAAFLPEVAVSVRVENADDVRVNSCYQPASICQVSFRQIETYISWRRS